MCLESHPEAFFCGGLPQALQTAAPHTIPCTQSYATLARAIPAPQERVTSANVESYYLDEAATSRWLPGVSFRKP